MRDLCLTCPLADCDETSPDCPLRAAWARVNRLRALGEGVPAETLAAARAWYNKIYYPEVRAQRSERNAA